MVLLYSRKILRNIIKGIGKVIANTEFRRLFAKKK